MIELFISIAIIFIGFTFYNLISDSYKIKHYLFGWDYVYWHNSADQGIARVFQAMDGSVVYYRYRASQLLDTVTKPSQVVWLTCHPDKYFK